jgi:hypothetical protein
MGSPSFGVPGTSNNAPLPIPGVTNPTGTNSGVGYGASFPNYPVFGAPSTGIVTPSADNGIFSGTGGLAGLSSGFGSIPGGSQYNSKLYDELGKAYGQGAGQLLGNMLTQGLYNPEVAAAYLNAMQPGIQQGNASVLNAFGDEGSRFGSAAALGEGNYQAQANLNEQQTLAGLFENAQQEQVGLLESVLPTLHAERADSGGWVDDLVGGLEVAGGVALDVATAGAATPISAGLIGAGASEINAGVNSATHTGASTPQIPSAFIPTSTTNTTNPSTTYPNSAAAIAAMNDWNQYNITANAGTAVGGSADGYDPSIWGNDPSLANSGTVPIFQ